MPYALAHTSTRNEEVEPLKRRTYRHRPVADTHGPKRPLSAYVQFGNDIRRRLENQNLSFTQLARQIGKSWQSLCAKDMDERQSQAAERKEVYAQELNRYQKTSNYFHYQVYLRKFKLKWATPGQSSKREITPPPQASGSIEADLASNGNTVDRCPSLDASLSTSLLSAFPFTPGRSPILEISRSRQMSPDIPGIMLSLGAAPIISSELSHQRYFDTILQTPA
jgi:hypothetical protein